MCHAVCRNSDSEEVGDDSEEVDNDSQYVNDDSQQVLDSQEVSKIMTSEWALVYPKTHAVIHY